MHLDLLHTNCEFDVNIYDLFYVDGEISPTLFITTHYKKFSKISLVP